MRLRGIILANAPGSAEPRFSRHLAPELVCVANEPLLTHALVGLGEAGVREAVIVVHPDWGEEIREIVGDGASWGFSVAYVARPPLGLMDGIRVADPLLGPGPVVAYPGNGILLASLREQVERMSAAGLGAGVFIGDPVLGDPMRSAACLLDEGARELLRELEPSWRGQLEFSDLVDMLVGRGRRVSLKPELWWSYGGWGGDLLEGNRLVLDQLTPEPCTADVRDSVVEGRVSISSAARIESTVVRGPAVIGPGAQLLDACVGPYTSVGAGATVSGVEVENSIVMAGAVLSDIGRRIEGSVIGEHTTINRTFAVRQALELRLGHGATATAG